MPLLTAVAVVAGWRRHLPGTVGHFRLQQLCHVPGERGLECKMEFVVFVHAARKAISSEFGLDASSTRKSLLDIVV